MDSNMQFEFSKQISNLGKKNVIFKTLATTFFEIKKKINNWRKNYQQCDVLDG